MTRAIIFDLGETLVRFVGDPVEVTREGVRLMHEFLRDNGIRLDVEQLYDRWVKARLEAFEQAQQDLTERTADDTLKKVLESFGLDDVPDELVRKAVDIFFEPEAQAYEAFPDADETLNRLKSKGFKLAVLSNATCDRLIKRLVRDANLDRYFDLVTSSAGLGIRKPHPNAFIRVLHSLGVKPSESFMVGDSQKHDVLGAHTVGMKAVLVHSEPSSYEDPKLMPDWAVKELSDVLEIVKKVGN